MRNGRLTSFGFFLMTSTLVIASLGLGQTTNTWTGGAANGQWGSGGNWSAGHAPTSGEQAVIPPGQGTITIPPSGASCHGITIEPSPGANPTKLTAGPPDNADVKVNFGAGGITVGAGNKIEAGGGSPGGDVNLNGKEGIVTNHGEINAGDGADGGPGVPRMPGGKVVIDCKTLKNHNVVNAGDGGDYSPTDPCAGVPQGHEGGNIGITTHDVPPETTDLGHMNAGDAGSGTVAGKGGDIYHNGKKLGNLQGRHAKGTRISLYSIDPLDLSGADAIVFEATETIRIDAPLVILTGIPAGTEVFHATEVCLPLNLLLDPGVSIQSLCGSAIVHLGSNCAAGTSHPVLGPETFAGAIGGAALGWTTITVQGPSGFNFVPAASVPGPVEPRFGCVSAVANAAQGGGAPMLCGLEPDVGAGIPRLEPVYLVEFSQRYVRTSPGGNVSLKVVVNNVATTAYSTNVTTPPFDFVQLDITPFLPPIGMPFSLRWQFQGAANDFWVLDNLALRLPAPGMIGQPPTPGVALFDIDDARNANNVPVFFPVAGPFFTDAPVNTTVNVHIEGPAFGTCWIGQSFIVPGSAFFPGLGQLDLDPLTLLLPLSLPLPGLGALDLPVFIPPPLSGLTLGFQAALTSPIGPVVLSNAVEVRFGP